MSCTGLLGVVLTLLLAGLTQGFQYPLQYHYHYRARVTSSIPEINDRQAAASDIRANFHVYVTSPTSVIFWLDEVEIADFHGNVDCELEDELPVEYRRPGPDDPAKLIGLHAFGADEEGIYFSESDPLWLTNFYKGILGFFNTPATKSVVFEADYTFGTQEDAFTLPEENILGSCNATYTQHKLTGFALNEYNKFAESHIEEDVQLDPAASTSKTGQKTTQRGHKTRGRKTTGTKRPPGASAQTSANTPLLAPTMWQLVKSVNLEDCDTRVEHQHAQSGVYCDLSRDQCKNQISRNSHTVYYIRGDSQGIRLEKAIMRGNFLVAPFGFESDMLSTDSIQKLALVSVKSLVESEVPDFSFAKVHETSWMYRMILPYERSTNPYQSWSNLGTLREALEQFTAHPITEEEQQENTMKAIGLIKKALSVHGISTEYKGANAAPSLLNYVTILLYDFNQEQMDSFMEMARSTLTVTEKDLLGGVLAEVGSVPSVKALLKMFQGEEVSEIRQAIIFSSLYKNIKSAAPLKYMMEYLMSQNIEESPFTTATSLINFASTIQSLCVRYPRSGSFSDFAHLQCLDDDIVALFEEFIISNLQKTSVFWKQMVYVKILINLGTKNGMSAIKPFILGQKECDQMVRVVAMQSLAKWNAPQGANRQEIMLTLLEMFENPAEEKHIRAKALSLLSSYKLSSTMWSRLAFSTKRPLLQDLGAFTYSLIKATSEYRHPEALQQALYAGHALRLAKKYSPYKRYSGFKTWYEMNFDKKIGLLDYMETIVDPLSPLPTEISLYTRRVLGGAVLHKKMDISIANDYGDLEIMAIELFRDMRVFYQDHGTSGNWDRFLQMLTSGLDISERVRDPLVGFADIIPVTDFQIFVPLQYEFLRSMMLSLSQLLRNENNVFYLNSMDTTLATVNDLGLPVIISVARPKLYSFSGRFDAYQSTSAEYTTSCLYCTMQYASTLRTHVETMALWSGVKVSTGVTQTRTVNLPLDFQAILNTPHPRKSRTGFSLQLKPSKQENYKPFSLVNAQNTPYTLLRGTAPGNLEEVQTNLKPVMQKETLGFKNDGLIPLPHGVVFSYDSDKPTTVPLLGGIDTILTTKFWIIDLSTDFTGRDEMIFTFNATRTHMDRAKNAGKYVSKYGQDSFREDELCGAESSDFSQQTGQTAADYYDYTQQSSNDVEFQSFGSDFGTQQTADVPQRFTMEENSDVEVDRASYGAPDASESILDTYMPFLRANKGWKHRINGYSLRVSVENDTTVPKPDASLELALVYTMCPNLQDRQKVDFVYVLASSQNPCDTMCLEGSLNTPKINDMDTLGTLVKKDLSREAEYSIYLGEKCKEGPYMQVTESRHLSTEILAKLLEEATDCDSFSHDPVEEFSVNAFYSTIDVNGTMNHEKDVPACATGKFYEKMLKLNSKGNEVMIKGSGIDKCLVENLKNNQRYRAERVTGSLFTGVLDIESQDGHQKVPFNMQIPYIVEYLVNRVDLNRPYDVEKTDQYCVINQTSLTSFDGMHTVFGVDPCPTLAVSNCEEGSYDKFAVGVSESRNGGLAINIVARYKEQIINMDSRGVEINGVRMPEDEYVHPLECKECYFSKIAGHVYKRNGFYKVEIDDTLSVILKEGQVYIKIAPRYFGYVCGLCGNHDGEKANDMKQPNGCFLTDAERFRKSWVPSSSFSCFSSASESRDTCVKEEKLDPQTYTEYTRVY